MSKRLLAEDFVNASKAYVEFQNAIMEYYEDDSIMSCRIGNLNRLADNYYLSIIHIYNNRMTLDEAMKIQKGMNAYEFI